MDSGPLRGRSLVGTGAVNDVHAEWCDNYRACRVEPSAVVAPEKPASRVVKASSTTFEGGVRVTNLNFGLMTMMAMPYLFNCSGLAAAIGLAAAVAVTVGSGILLGHVLESLRARDEFSQPDMGDIGQVAFGAKFGSICSAIMLIDCALLAVVLLIMIGVNAPLVVPGLSVSTAIFATAFVAGMLDSVPDSVFAVLEVGSISTTLVACMLVVITGLMLPDGPTEAPPLIHGDLTGFLKSFAVGFYGCAFHVYYPGLFHAMGDRRKYTRAMVGGNVAYFVLACAFGSSVAYMFGNAIQPIATQNVAHDLDLKPLGRLQWASRMVGVLVIAKNMLTLRPSMKPLLAWCCSPGDDRKGHTQWLRRSFCYCVLACCACYLADAIIEVESLVALLLYSLVSIMFPVACYVRLQKPLSQKALVGATAAMALGSSMFLHGAAHIVNSFVAG